MIKQTVITPRPQTVKKRRPRGAGWLAAHAVSLLSFALLLTISAAYVGALPDTVSVVSGKRELPIYCVNRDDNKISISFDAAWGGDKTLGILDLLDEYNIKTTFFLVDIWTQKYPELVTEIVARGHEIGNHSTSHPQMSKLNETQIAKELNTQADNVLAIAGASHGSFVLVVLGFLISIPIIVGGSTLIGKIMDRFPVVLYAGAGLLGWTAGSMIAHDKILGTMITSAVGDWAAIAIQAVLAVGVILTGFCMSRRAKSQTA